MLRSARRARLEARTTTMHILDGDRRPGSAPQGRPPGDRARVLARPFALHDRDHRQLLVREPVGLHVAQHGNHEQSRRPQGAIGLLELAGEAGRRHDVAGAPDARATALAMGVQYVSHSPEAIRRGGVADMDHERAAADRGAVDPFRGDAEIMRDGHRRLAAIATPSMSAGLSPASAIALSAASECNSICAELSVRDLETRRHWRTFERCGHGRLRWLKRPYSFARQPISGPMRNEPTLWTS